MTPHRILLPTALLAAAALAGCGGNDTAPQNPSAPPAQPMSSAPAESSQPESDASSQAPASPAMITISDFAYDIPQTVSAGQQITVRNEDDVPHTVTATDNEELFDVEIPPASEATFTAPEKAGNYPFFCAYHPNMTAELSVS